MQYLHKILVREGGERTEGRREGGEREGGTEGGEWD